MLSPQYAPTADSHGTPAAKTRGALALGLVGALGEELLASLVNGIDYAYVHVTVTSSVGLATSRFRPWKVGDGVVLADDAFVAVTGDETYLPAGSPIARYGEAQVLEASRIARGCGVARLTVIAPLAALLNNDAPARTLDFQIEGALRQMGFERLLIVWPTAADAIGGTGVRGMLRALGRALPDIMLPGDARALTARSAALAIAEAARTAPPGVTVLGVRELLRISAARRPALAQTKQQVR